MDFKAYHWNALSIEGLSNGLLHQAFAGTNGLSYHVLVSSNLANWTSFTNTIIGPASYFDIFDTIGPNPVRFYRVVSP